LDRTYALVKSRNAQIVLRCLLYANSGRDDSRCDLWLFARLCPRSMRNRTIADYRIHVRVGISHSEGEAMRCISFTMTLAWGLLLALPTMAHSQTTTTPKPVKPITTVAPNTTVAPKTTTRATTTKTETSTKTKTKQELIEDKKAGLGGTRGQKTGVHKEEMTPEQKKAHEAELQKLKATSDAKKAECETSYNAKGPLGLPSANVIDHMNSLNKSGTSASQKEAAYIANCVSKK
jgi:hypothetical protein